jgi:hypothetical protein
MNQEQIVPQAQVLRHARLLAIKAEQARSRSRMLVADVVKVAEQVADTEEVVAETLMRLASQHPPHGRRLLAMSKAASDQAVRERERANGHAEPWPTVLSSARPALVTYMEAALKAARSASLRDASVGHGTPERGPDAPVRRGLPASIYRRPSGLT